MSYSYNRAGALTSQTYPSGRVVDTNYDSAGRIAGVKNNATGSYYAGAASTDESNRFQYSVHGAIQAMKLGNGLWEHTNFNSRLQITQIGLGTSSTDSSKLKLDYAYGVLESGVLNPTKNNGNIQSQILTLPGLVLTQSYLYDELNRLKSAQEMNSGTQVWKQTFSFDRFGNRRFDAANTTLPQITLQNEVSTNPTISTIDNRISAAGYRFDLAGNLECDPTHPCGSTAPFPPYYEYDGENRIKSANGGASYFYDGDGRRIKKIVGDAATVTTVFVYDIVGQLIAEYSDQQQTSGGTSYLTADHLGTPRVITGADASVSGRHDYQPFGEEIAATYGGRAGIEGYPAGDALRQQFTLKERDNETGLDYFGARYYGSIQGRFTSADPLLASGSIYDPQTWNRYAYTLNNPVRYIDPLGLYEWDASLGGSATDEVLKKQKGGKKIIGKRNEFRNALSKAAAAGMSKSLNERQRAELKRSVEAYGKEGVSNGVAIGTGKLENGAQAETGFAKDATGGSKPFTTTGAGPWSVTPNITVTFDGKISEDEVAHEGSHVADRLDLVAGAELLLNFGNGTGDIHGLRENVTKYATEFRAYQVSSSIDQLSNRTSEVWNRGWSEADRANAINKLLRENKLYKVSPPGTKPGPGPRLLEHK